MCIYPHSSRVFMIAHVNSTSLGRATHYRESWSIDMTGKNKNWYQVVAKYIRMNVLKQLVRTRTDITLQLSELMWYFAILLAA